MFYNSGKIDTFKEVLDYIFYDWDYTYTLSKDSEGIFYINKLSIGPNFLNYKTENYEIDKELYNKVNTLYKLLQENTRSENIEEYNKLIIKIQKKLDKNNYCELNLARIPMSERKSLEQLFKNKGFTTYLFRDNQYIRIYRPTG